MGMEKRLRWMLVTKDIEVIGQEIAFRWGKFEIVAVEAFCLVATVFQRQEQKDYDNLELMRMEWIPEEANETFWDP